jgi:triosephosphate isomerase
MSRTRWVIGNWKQHLRRAEATALARQIVDATGGGAASAGHAVTLGLAPTYLALDAVHAALHGSPIVLFAQDAAAQEHGAHTGEVGPAMLEEAGVRAVILGHSERRQELGEADELVGRKLAASLAAGLRATLCVGEPLAVRDAGRAQAFVLGQLAASLDAAAAVLGGDQALPMERVSVAYEPVWAIGTGRTATPDQAAEMHRALRAALQARFGHAGGDRSILYGGSVKPENAAQLLAAGDIDGFLVGGASLDATAFAAIALAAARTP